MVPHFSGTHSISGKGFPLRHSDRSVNNLYVDDDLNITCVIDWGFSSSVPFTELLTTSGMPYPRCLPGPSLVASFRAGFKHEYGDVPFSYWEDVEKIWHFQRLVYMDSLQDYEHFAEL